MQKKKHRHTNRREDQVVRMHARMNPSRRYATPKNTGCVPCTTPAVRHTSNVQLNVARQVPHKTNRKAFQLGLPMIQNISSLVPPKCHGPLKAGRGLEQGTNPNSHRNCLQKTKDPKRHIMTAAAHKPLEAKKGAENGAGKTNQNISGQQKPKSGGGRPSHTKYSQCLQDTLPNGATNAAWLRSDALSNRSQTKSNFPPFLFVTLSSPPLPLGTRTRRLERSPHFPPGMRPLPLSYRGLDHDNTPAPRRLSI